MQPQSRFVIPQDHPSLPGHFPGQPIVPGVVVLDCAMAVLLRDRPTARLAGFDEVKFVALVSPGAEVCISGRNGAHRQSRQSRRRLRRSRAAAAPAAY